MTILRKRPTGIFHRFAFTLDRHAAVWPLNPATLEGHLFLWRAEWLVRPSHAMIRRAKKAKIELEFFSWSTSEEATVARIIDPSLARPRLRVLTYFTTPCPPEPRWPIRGMCDDQSRVAFEVPNST